MPKEGINVVGIYDHQNNVDMRCLDKHVADPNGIALACRGETTLHDRLTQRISQE
jgi:hypothetical protein